MALWGVWSYSATGDDSDRTKSASDKSWPSQFMPALLSSGVELLVSSLNLRPLTSRQDSPVISLPDDLKSVLKTFGLRDHYKLFQVMLIGVINFKQCIRPDQGVNSNATCACAFQCIAVLTMLQMLVMVTKKNDLVVLLLRIYGAFLETCGCDCQNFLLFNCNIFQ